MTGPLALFPPLKCPVRSLARGFSVGAFHSKHPNEGQHSEEQNDNVKHGEDFFHFNSLPLPPRYILVGSNFGVGNFWMVFVMVFILSSSVSFETVYLLLVKV